MIKSRRGDYLFDLRPSSFAFLELHTERIIRRHNTFLCLRPFKLSGLEGSRVLRVM